MSRVHLTRTAEEDLLAIARYVAADNPTAAAELIERFDRALALYAAQPEAAAVYQPRPQYRHFVLASYVVFYQMQDDGILVTRVLHAARDIPRHLD